MSSLRDALKKAGFTEAKVEPKPEVKTEKKPAIKPDSKKEEKREERRPPSQHNNQRNDRRPPHSQHSSQRQAPPARPSEPRSFVKADPPVKKHEHHFKTRNFCDQCQKTLPDVELYERRGQTKWMCVLCADELMILDENRRTAQSDFSKNGTFRRQYGRTLPNRVIESKAQEIRAREQRPQANSQEDKKPIRRFNDQAPRERAQRPNEEPLKKEDKK